MNYASLFAAKEYFVNHTLSTKEFVYKLNSILVRYKENTNKMLLNLLDSDFDIDKLNIDCLILHASIGNGGSILELSNERLFK